MLKLGLLIEMAHFEKVVVNLVLVLKNAKRKKNFKNKKFCNELKWVVLSICFFDFEKKYSFWKWSFEIKKIFRNKFWKKKKKIFNRIKNC